jgi:hypothetical protein
LQLTRPHRYPGSLVRSRLASKIVHVPQMCLA